MDELIESVKKHPVLYDIKSSNYSNQKMRQEAWEQVGLEVNIAAEDAKQKWNKLRRCFCNAINRRRNKDGEAPKKILPWKFEPQMRFLFPFLGSRPSQGHTEDPEVQVFQYFTDANQEQYQEENENLGDGEDSETKNYNSDLQIEEYLLGRSQFDNQSTATKVVKDTKTQKRARHKTNSDAAQKIVDIIKENGILRNTKNESLQSKSICYCGMDETDMFFLSMARMTKQLPRSEQSKIKLTLSNAVLQADIRNQEKHSLIIKQPPHFSPASSSTDNSDNTLFSPNEQSISAYQSTKFKTEPSNYD